MWRHLFFVFGDIFSCRYSMIITFLTVFIGTQPTVFFVAGNCSRKLFDRAVSGGYLFFTSEKCGSSIFIAFWYVFDYYLRLQITNASGHSTSQHSRHTVLNSSIRRTMPDESGAARLHIGLIDNLNARLPRHTPIACDGFITLGLWLSVSIRSRLSSLTSHLRYVKPKMLSLALSRSSRISGLVRRPNA